MSSAVGLASTSKNMGFDENKVDDKEGTPVSETNVTGSDHVVPVVEPETEDEDDEDLEGKIQLGPKCTLKELSEKDKEDESLRRWKEQLLGSVDINSAEETLDPEVQILSLAIKSPGRPDIFLLVPEAGNPKGPWFTLKEGSRYSLKFTFQVSNNIVSGLRYRNTVWKSGIKVDNTREMIGTFCPQSEPYTHEMPDETTPSGIFARGSYSAKTQFLDDDNRCYLGMTYTFDIRKEWQSTKN
ncbi:rho GDP-dissociation inhibitor 1-like [Olea europaea var. sylvestris]|uniref:rho GDP-dissociation inhibitor 1-like n=1 Tax=Olea europaea var. sylvestris TaxID=158386 RepID=UPI000C1CF31F|nr:rho GDP-dissociation inhibitor 1-like [Olea europaea var. sylvestris]XP_022892262.1 rho GDP-dissociation inhibitor 1-like [Olea europaea var. sylvestris]XP_022892263.1 rho GDP-dissociation inhibitor 1-like [Olea europaea var. sylvestris]